MSAITMESGLGRAVRIYEATVGKKAVMAITGFILFGFVVGHLIGNLQIYAGPEKINAYAKLLRVSMPLLWTVRLVLLAAVVLHVVAALQLKKLNWDARPVKYVKYDPAHSTLSSRTMFWGGLTLAAFVIYHLLHFTTGTVHPDFVELSVYDNVVKGFQVLPVSTFYIIAMILLGMHLYHGLWSMLHTLGFSHPRYTPWIKRLAAVFAVLIAAGNISIPVAVLAGIIGS